jgi:hypothetical protein
MQSWNLPFQFPQILRRARMHRKHHRQTLRTLVCLSKQTTWAQRYSRNTKNSGFDGRIFGATIILWDLAAMAENAVARFLILIPIHQVVSGSLPMCRVGQDLFVSSRVIQ